MNPTLTILALCMLALVGCQELIVTSPIALAERFKSSKISAISSPIGFKPRSGTLHGKLSLASPLNACRELPTVPFD